MTATGPFLLGKQAQAIAQLMRDKRSVCVEGGWGSGRTTVLNDVARELELTGINVLHMKCQKSLQEYPFAALSQVTDLLKIKGLTTPVTAADSLSRSLTSSGPLAVVIDNAEHIDNASLTTVSLIKDRLDIAVAYSVPNVPIERTHLAKLSQEWQAQLFSLLPFRFEQTAELAELMLHGPVERNLLSHLFTQSGGNPRLLVALISSAKEHQQIELCNGLWVSNTNNFWHEDLLLTIESLLAPLSKDHREALFIIGLLAPCAISDAMRQVDAHILRDLETAHLAALSSAGGSIITLTPPILVDYVRQEATPGQRLGARHRLLPTVDPVDARWERTESSVAAKSHLDIEVAEDATLAHLLDEQAGLRTQALWRLWCQTHFAGQGVAYLQAVWNTQTDADHTSEVLSELDETAFEDMWLGLLIATMRAQWYAHRLGDLQAGLSVLDSFSEARPEMSKETQAYGLFLRTTYGDFPKNYVSILKPTGNEPTGSIQAIVLAFLHLVSMNTADSLKALDLAPDGKPALLDGLASVTRIIALYHEGRETEAHDFASHAMKNARRHLDKEAILSIGYGLSLILFREGRWSEMEQLAGSIFSVGRPGMATAPIYAALLRLCAFLAVLTKRKFPAKALLRSANDVYPGPSALPGTDSALSRAVDALIDDDVLLAAQEMFDSANLQVESNLILSAFTSARIAYNLDPTEKYLCLFEKIVTDHPARDYSKSIAISRAAIALDGPKTKELIMSGIPEDDVPFIVVFLEQVIAKYADSPKSVKTLLPAQEYLHKHYSAANFRVELLPDTVDTVLSDREFEIALLVGSLDNSAIADRLGISARTVENHVYNAMKKAKVTDRSSLFSFASTRLRSSQS